MSCFVGKVLPPAKQRFPFPPRQPAIFKVGARPFAAVIEETDVIIGFFNRLDLARDESVELGEIGDQVGRQCKIQGNSPGTFLSLSPGPRKAQPNRLRWEDQAKANNRKG